VNKSKIEWTDYWLGWISALIDGEGSLSLLKERRPRFKAGCTYKPRLNIANKNIEIMLTAKILFRGGSLCENKKGVWNLDISSNRIRENLPKISLIAKERQRLLLLDALDVLNRRTTHFNPRTDMEIQRLERIYLKIRELNGKVWNKNA